MEMLQNVAQTHGLVCLLHEKPFAGVNGSGKHNNWSMGTDSGENLLDPGDTPHDNLQFLFFCAAVIQAVNKHQGLLRASVASAGQRPPPRRQRGAAGDHLDLPRRAARATCSTAIEKGKTTKTSKRRVVPRARRPIPCRRCRSIGGDRNRTSPFAFTGNKFEFRAVGSSSVGGFANTVLNTIVAEAIDDLAAKLKKAQKTKRSLEAALTPVLKAAIKENNAVLFGGDGYSDEWHAEAEKRGLKNLRTTPDALPEMVAASTVKAFTKYKVLNKRELESRYDVATEQYVTASTSRVRRPPRWRGR